MANTLQDMLGIASTGLGPNMTAINSQQQLDTQNRTSLADLMNKQLTNEAAQLKLGEDRATSGTRIQAVNAENLGKVTDANVKNYQKFGELAGQLSGALGNLPPAARTQALVQIGEKIPGIKDSKVFQSLLNTDPNQIPGVLKQLGNDVALKATKYIQDSSLQKQSDEAAMARTQASEAGANARNAATIAAANKRAQLSNLNAVEVAKIKQAAASGDALAELILKEGPENAAAFAAFKLNQAKTPAERKYWDDFGRYVERLGKGFRIAGAKPGTTLDESGNPVRQDVYGAQGGNVFGDSSAPVGRPVNIPGLPQGTVQLDENTFQLPDGRKIRRKQ